MEKHIPFICSDDSAVEAPISESRKPSGPALIPTELIGAAGFERIRRHRLSETIEWRISSQMPKRSGLLEAAPFEADVLDG
jgi:hypothetical protein